MYLLSLDEEKYICRVYQKSIFRHFSHKKNSKFEFEISLLNEISFVDFSNDSNYILILCKTSEYEDWELFAFSIELRKFVLYISNLKYSKFQQLEKYLIFGNDHGAFDIFELKLPSSKPDFEITEKISNINFYFN